VEGFMSKSSQINRRGFLKKTTTAAAAISAGPLIMHGSPASTEKNNRVVMGMIGTGTRGCTLLRGIREMPDVAVGAVCDFYEPHLAAGKELAGPQAKEYWEYRKLLEQKDLDAVFICVTPYYHYEIYMAAIDANRHVFVEKPLANTIEQCNDIVRAARRSKKIFQVGHQRRYMANYLTAMDMIQRGTIGKVHLFHGYWHRNYSGGRGRSIRDEATGEYHGTIPLHKLLRWRSYRELSGGEMTDKGPHQMDIANWLAGQKPPLRISGLGTLDRVPSDPEMDAYDNINVVYTYPEFHVYYTFNRFNAHLGVQEIIMGTEGSIELSTGGGFLFREGRTLSEEIAKKYGGRVDRELQKYILVTGATIQDIEPDRSKGEDFTGKGEETVEEVQRRIGYDATKEYSHLKEFFSDLRANKKTFASAEVGRDAAVVCIAANIAMDEHREVVWDKNWSI